MGSACAGGHPHRFTAATHGPRWSPATFRASCSRALWEGVARLSWRPSPHSVAAQLPLTDRAYVADMPCGPPAACPVSPLAHLCLVLRPVDEFGADTLQVLEFGHRLGGRHRFLMDQSLVTKAVPRLSTDSPLELPMVRFLLFGSESMTATPRLKA